MQLPHTTSPSAREPAHRFGAFSYPRNPSNRSCGAYSNCCATTTESGDTLLLVVVVFPSNGN